MIINKLFTADASEDPGAVYQVLPGSESTYYRRNNRRIYSFAFSPSGAFFFVNANEKSVYRLYKFLWFTFALKIYTHSTYIRNVVFDNNGVMYFSESSGAGGDGKIFRLSGSFIFYTATLVEDVPLAEAGGFWAGDFCFEHNNTLLISSGNRIPASIYRKTAGSYQVLYTSNEEPIKGLAFLTCDLLCFANWRSEIHMLDLQSNIVDTVYSNPIHNWISDVGFYQPTIDVDTMYEGVKEYRCDSSSCWRLGGTVNTNWSYFFPNIDVTTPDVQTLLNDIGAGTNPVSDDVEIWQRTRTVWAWINTHALGPGDATFQESCDYRASLGHWPSIEEFAYMFMNYGGFCWLSNCTCMCRAQTLATLLYRAGIPIDRMIIAETKWKVAYSQHMYVVLKLGCHWYYIDPSVNVVTLGETPENVGGASADYVHPNELKLLPGSTLTKPMLVR